MTSAATVGEHDRLRLFLALELPPATLDALERWRDEHLQGGRAMERDKLHITLAFLGSRPAAELPSIVDALRDAALPTGSLALEPLAWRETRSVGMVVLHDSTGEAKALAVRLLERLSAAYLSRLHPSGARYEVLERVSLNAGG